MMIFKVKQDRFYEEYRIHVQHDSKRSVNWFVDDKSILHMYIFTDYSYGYYLSCNSSEIPDMLKECISKMGETLGILESNKLELSEDSLQSLKKSNSSFFPNLNA